MCKVKCKVCGDIGYTAAPEHIICKCGGRFRVLREKREERLARINENEGILALFNLADPVNFGYNGNLN